jgi:hypothetical protein
MSKAELIKVTDRSPRGGRVLVSIGVPMATLPFSPYTLRASTTALPLARFAARTTSSLRMRRQCQPFSGLRLGPHQSHHPTSTCYSWARTAQGIRSWVGYGVSKRSWQTSGRLLPGSGLAARSKPSQKLRQSSWSPRDSSRLASCISRATAYRTRPTHLRAASISTTAG